MDDVKASVPPEPKRARPAGKGTKVIVRRLRQERLADAHQTLRMAFGTCLALADQ